MHNRTRCTICWRSCVHKLNPVYAALPCYPVIIIPIDFLIAISLQGFESRTDLGGAASGSSRFCESYLDSSTSEMMAGGNDFPRSGSTNALTRVASGTQLSHAGSATNLLNLSAIACQSGQRSQYEESSDASTQALQRSLSQLKLAQQQGACGLGPLQEDCRAEIDRCARARFSCIERARGQECSLQLSLNTSPFRNSFVQRR